MPYGVVDPNTNAQRRRRLKLAEPHRRATKIIPNIIAQQANCGIYTDFCEAVENWEDSSQVFVSDIEARLVLPFVVDTSASPCKAS